MKKFKEWKPLVLNLVTVVIMVLSITLVELLLEDFESKITVLIIILTFLYPLLKEIARGIEKKTPMKVLTVEAPSNKELESLLNKELLCIAGKVEKINFINDKGIYVAIIIYR